MTCSSCVTGFTTQVEGSDAVGDCFDADLICLVKGDTELGYFVPPYGSR